MAEETDEPDEELGSIEWAVVEFPVGSNRFSAETLDELSTLVECELIRVIDLVIIDKLVTDGFAVVEYEALGETSGLPVLEGRLAEVLAFEDIENVARAITPGFAAGVLVWENTWSAPFGVAVRRSGGQLLDGGLIPALDLVSAVRAGDRGDPTMPERPGRASSGGVIGRPVARTSAPIASTVDLMDSVRRRQTGVGPRRDERPLTPDPFHREPKGRHVHGR